MHEAIHDNPFIISKKHFQLFLIAINRVTLSLNVIIIVFMIFLFLFLELCAIYFSDFVDG